MYRNIGAAGCQHLSGANFKNLSSLNLGSDVDTQGNNNIGAEGCKYLSGADWKNLSSLGLRIYVGMQGIMI